MRDQDERSAPWFLERTIETWQPFSPNALSKTDAKEIIRNLVSFLELLATWNYAEKRQGNDEPGFSN